MEKHVDGLFIVSGIWWLIISFAGYFLPKRFSKIFLLFTVIAHSYGACTWISPRLGFWAAMALILLNSFTYVFINDQNQELNPKTFLK